ncbi:FecCD family ABC transporter permease [Sphingomonas prati]|uniref:Iron complex transport system permease protein n=1 Tax=Sphingomonas prati TaxID=1843237 RepID=A0A7W9F068_9SPHN|nr:iron ABC transporter permease [Sphingomonas prati]MBB5728072.1 iron complex transport system permease protein [Sphingomonas prati]GGE83021.1 ABC transporter permease [Sphingomonas prati]
MTRLNLALLVGVLLAVCLSVASGKVWVPLDAWTAVDPRSIIIVELRLPRTVMALLVGAALGLSGAVMQGYLRNPLADPGLFGVSSGAALGAVVSLYFGYAAQIWLLPTFALVGAAGTMALLALIAGRSGSLILFTLAGMILTSIAGSLTALAISLAPTPFVSSQIVTWLLGALTDRSWDDVKVALPIIVIGAGLLATTARSLDALTLGEQAARSMGVDPGRLQWVVIAGIALTVGAAVASAGVIGFVGLIVPHMVRPFAGNRPSAVLLPSALGGALLLTLADSLVRLAPTVSELRLGIAMSMLGGPFFLYLLIRMRRRLA